jgi:hypothetical protein
MVSDYIIVVMIIYGGVYYIRWWFYKHKGFLLWGLVFFNR